MPIAAFFRDANRREVVRLYDAGRLARTKVRIAPSHRGANSLRRIALAMNMPGEYPTDFGSLLEPRLHAALEIRKAGLSDKAARRLSSTAQ